MKFENSKQTSKKRQVTQKCCTIKIKRVKDFKTKSSSPNLFWWDQTRRATLESLKIGMTGSAIAVRLKLSHGVRLSKKTYKN